MAYNYETIDYKKQKKNLVLVPIDRFSDPGVQSSLYYRQQGWTTERGNGKEWH